MTDLLSKAIGEIYDLAASGQFFENLPDIIANAAGGRSCVVQKTDRALAPVAMSYSWFSPEMAQAYVRERIFVDDVWANCAVEHGIYDRTTDIGTLTGPDRYARSRFFQDFIRPHGDDTGQCLGAILSRPEGGFLTYGTHRALRDRTFRDDDVRLLDLLNPHLLRAASIDDRLGQARQGVDHLRAVLDRLGGAVLTIGPSLKVTMANPAAEDILARRDGMLLSSGSLTAVTSSSRQRLAQAVDSALGHRGRHGGSLLIERRGGRSPYRVMVSPLPLDGITHAMILIDDPDGELREAADRLRELYRFTRAESDVAILIGRGLSTEEIADLRGVGQATIKTLLQRCFRKSDTHRATQLARLVNRLPR